MLLVARVGNISLLSLRFILLFPFITSSVSFENVEASRYRSTRWCLSSWDRHRQQQVPTCLAATTCGLDTKVKAIIPLQSQKYKLWSYAHHIRRTRWSNCGEINNGTSQQPRRAAYSLLNYLTNNVIDRFEFEDENLNLDVALCRAVVQGVRLGSTMNDYKLILKLIDSAIHFADLTPLVQPRIIGEAIDGLTLTSANIGKIKSVWNRLNVTSEEECKQSANRTYLTGPHSAYETNAMLSAFISRGKMGSALYLFRSCQQSNQIDSYSLNILIEAWTKSMSIDTNLTTDTAFPSESLRLFQAMLSPCRQWNDAISTIDRLISESSQHGIGLVNNHVLAALLKLNAKAGELFQKHDTATLTIRLLEWIEGTNIHLDSISCNLLLVGMSSQWVAALSLFQRMKSHETLLFAKPNTFVYMTIIAVCAKARQFKIAVDLFNDLEKDSSCGQPNTMNYNSVLKSLSAGNVVSFRRRKVPTTKRIRRETFCRVQLTCRIFTRLHEKGLADSTTYNRMLSILASSVGILQESDWNRLWTMLDPIVGPIHRQNKDWYRQLPQLLISKMMRTGLRSDGVTYRHAFAACSTIDVLMELIQVAHADAQCFISPEIVDSSLPIAAAIGGIDGLCKVMRIRRSPISPEMITQLIISLGVCNKSSLIPILIERRLDLKSFQRLEGEQESILNVSNRSALAPHHFDTALQTCLRANDFVSAESIIRKRNSNDIQFNRFAVQDIARMCALQVLKPLQNRRYPLSLSQVDDSSSQLSTKDYALHAFTALQKIDNPPFPIMILVVKALASSGLFDCARRLLCDIHARLLHNNEPIHVRNKLLQGVRTMHSSILSSCAVHGNVTAALRFCKSIQAVPCLSDFSHTICCKQNNLDSCFDSVMNLRVSDWMVVLVAALRSENWRVSHSLLQHFRQTVESLRPVCDEKRNLLLSRQYRRISPAVNHAVKCLTLRSQYVCTIRVLDDWISWSNRRPPKQSVFLAIRALCAQGRGTEVGNLLARCFAPVPQDLALEGPPYEIAIAVFAITSLYNEGLYDAADDVFVTAITTHTLPFDLREQVVRVDHSLNLSRQMTLDLHGMNVAVAHAAVRIALQQMAKGNWAIVEGSGNVGKDLTIVTGRGRMSAFRMRPILRPEVQRMLMEEFYPPLNSYSIPGNMGALRIPGVDVENWLHSQRAARYSRVMTIAAILRKISVDTIRAAVAVSNPASIRIRKQGNLKS